MIIKGSIFNSSYLIYCAQFYSAIASVRILSLSIASVRILSLSIASVRILSLSVASVRILSLSIGEILWEQEAKRT